MLLAEETESTKEIRRNVCCKLAETLLFGCSEAKYTKPGLYQALHMGGATKKVIMKIVLLWKSPKSYSN